MMAPLMKFCNLCSFPIIRINKNIFGTRCINCRSTFIHRALGFYFKKQNFSKEILIHEFSNHGAFFKFLKKEYKNLTTSEYFYGIKPGEYKNMILCQDVQNLSFKNESFEVFTSTEVFEHVQDDVKGFSEVLRCLKPGGHFIFTVPIDSNVKNTLTRAKVVDGEIVHILPPEYHGDHLSNKGILAFRTYGMDIEQKLLDVGFSYAKVHIMHNPSIAVDIKKPIVHCTK